MARPEPRPTGPTTAPRTAEQPAQGAPGGSGGRVDVDGHSEARDLETALFEERIAVRDHRARLEDVAPTVLHALGVESPPDYDGEILPIFS